MNEPTVNARNSFFRAVGKHAGRARERILQNLGKADKTSDEQFDEYSNNFLKQQKSAEKYHKEIKNYVTCAKAVETSIQNLIEIVSEIYEDEWSEKDTMENSLQTLLKIQAAYNVKLHEDVLGAVNSYLGQFPEIKNKVAKRGRKLVDFDSARHNLESLQSHKKKEEVKINKAKEQLDEAKLNFEPLHAELQEELPALYDSRIPFYASSLQSLFSAEMNYHNDSAGVYGILSEGIDKLALSNQKGLYDTRRKSAAILNTPESPPRSGLSPSKENNSINNIKEINGQPEPKVPEIVDKTPNGQHQMGEPSVEPPQYKPPPVVDVADVEPIVEAPPSYSDVEKTAPPTASEPVNSTTTNSDHPNTNSTEVKKAEETIEIPPDATTTNLPLGVLYRVKTTYKYQADDSDELSFEKDEIIEVILYDDPEEKEEGWLMGVHETSKKKGLFPANFTKPI